MILLAPLPRVEILEESKRIAQPAAELTNEADRWATRNACHGATESLPCS
jgi:hypothetical protein